MANMVLTKGDDGKLRGLTESDERRWTKFRAAVSVLGVGDTVKASFNLPRSPGFHKRHFLILASMFHCQDQFTSFEAFREWTQVGAGFCDILPGPKGKPVAISRSIAWEALDDADFAEHHAAVVDFMRSVHFSRFLWGHLDDAKGTHMVESVLQEFTA